MDKKSVWLSWSSGKDSAWCLRVLREDPNLEVKGLLTTVNATHDRVAMHAVRTSILDAQSRSLGLPLHIIQLPWPCSNETYESEMRQAIEKAESAGVRHMAFGDLFLEDIRAYRVGQLSQTSLEPIFPIWGLPTDALSRRMVDDGVEAVVTCVDPKQLPGKFVGKRYDHSFLDQLPKSVDPCGERGEFHTCVLKGPGFRDRIVANVGEIVERDGFVFADVVPANPPPIDANRHLRS